MDDSVVGGRWRTARGETWHVAPAPCLALVWFVFLYCGEKAKSKGKSNKDKYNQLITNYPLLLYSYGTTYVVGVS